jgi:hypothetical protein
MTIAITVNFKLIQTKVSNNMRKLYLTIISILIILNIVLSIKLKNISTELNETSNIYRITKDNINRLKENSNKWNDYIFQTELDILEDYCFSVLSKFNNQ